MKSRRSKLLLKISATVAAAAAVVLAGVFQASPAAAYRAGSEPLEITSGLRLNHPFGVAVDAQRHLLYVADSLNNRVLELSASGAVLHQWHGWGSRPFNQPGAVAVGRSGTVYVIDYGHNRIDRFAADGRPLESWGSYGTSPGEFAVAADVATDPAGNVYVADTLNFRIQKFSPTGRLLDAWTTLTSTQPHVMAPIGIGVAPDRDLYVSEVEGAVDRFGNFIEATHALHCVQSLSPAGRFLAGWGSKGSLPGQFREPRGIVVDGARGIYVADFGNNRIQQFTSDGGFQRSVGPAVRHGLRLRGPAALALDEQGNIYVADWFNSRIDRLSPSGQVLATWK